MYTQFVIEVIWFACISKILFYHIFKHVKENYCINSAAKYKSIQVETKRVAHARSTRGNDFPKWSSETTGAGKHLLFTFETKTFVTVAVLRSKRFCFCTKKLPLFSSRTA